MRTDLSPPASSDASTAATGKRHIITMPRLLFLLCTVYFVAFVDRVNIGIAATAFAPEFHFTKQQIGWTIGAFGWTYVVFQIIGGMMGDRMSARRMLTLCGIIVGLATLSIGLATGFTSILVARLFLGVGEGAMFPLVSRVIADSVPHTWHSRVQGLTHACGRLANALTPLIIGSLIAWGSWRISFIVVGALSLGWAALWFWQYRDGATVQPMRNAAALPAIPAGAFPPAGQIGTAAEAIEHESMTPGALPAGKGKRISGVLRASLPLSAVYFCYGWAFYLFLGWIPAYLVQSRGLDIKHSAVFSSIIFLAGVVGDLVGGVASDAILKRTGSSRLARRYFMGVSLLLAALCVAPMPFLQSTPAICACLAGALFFCELIVAPIWALPITLVPRDAAVACGIMSAGATISGAISPVVTGIIIDKTGNWSLPFELVVVLLLAGAVMACLSGGKTRARSA